MDCRKAQSIVDDVGDLDRLPPEAARHVAGCADCERFGDDLVRLRALLREPARVAAPEDFDAQLARRLRAARSTTRVSRPVSAWRWLPDQGLAAAAAIVLVVASAAVVDRVLFDAPPAAETTVAEAGPTAPPVPAPIAEAPAPGSEATVAPAEIDTHEAQPAIARVARAERVLPRRAARPEIAPAPREAMVHVSDARGSRVVEVPEVLVGAEQLVPAADTTDAAFASRRVSF
jgi:hypothetical protein